MKTVFVLKITSEGMPGYFDGKFNWDGDVYKAQRFESYPAAEEALKGMFESHGVGGMVQIEKYFVEG